MKNKIIAQASKYRLVKRTIEIEVKPEIGNIIPLITNYCGNDRFYDELVITSAPLDHVEGVMYLCKSTKSNYDDYVIVRFNIDSGKFEAVITEYTHPYDEGPPSNILIARAWKMLKDGFCIQFTERRYVSDYLNNRPYPTKQDEKDFLGN